MRHLCRRLASIRLTVLGMLLLAGGATISYGNPAHAHISVLVVPMALLAVNLLAAVISNPNIRRQPGLLVFHLSLLGLVLCAAYGRLTHLDAHLEIVTGKAFTVEDLTEVRAGPWNTSDLQSLEFIQGPYSVEYGPGMVRGLTYSHVSVRDDQGQWQPQVVGDDRPLVIDGHRFYTTFNKGFSTVLTWIPEQGEAITGTVNMPPYPLFDYRQDNQWTPPGGSEIKFWLQLETALDENSSWVLDGQSAKGRLVATVNGKRVEVDPGESTQLDNGVLRYDGLTTWMGYKIFYDPTLHWMFFFSMVGLLGLSAHFWKKFENPSRKVLASKRDRSMTETAWLGEHTS